MDIYSAQKNVQKLLKYVQDVADSKPNMYEKSKMRLKDLAATCIQVVDLISSILADEALSTDISEFSSVNPDIADVVKNMQVQLDHLKEFTGACSVDRTHELASSITSSSKKQFMKDLKLCLHDMASSSSGIPYADTCCQMLWTWFDMRFYRTVSGTKFSYNIRRIRGWIRDFVILYSYSVSTDHEEEFISTFNAWIESINSGDAKQKYAVPYTVFQFNKNPDPAKLTLHAAVLWDILLSIGLSKVCSDKDDLYLSSDMVYDMCEELNPNCLDNYVDYRAHPEIIARFGWTLQRKDDTEDVG